MNPDKASSGDISRYPVPDINTLPDDIRERIIAVQEKAGFIPNVFLALAYRPDEFRAFFSYHDAIMYRGSQTTSFIRWHVSLVVDH